MVLAQRGVIVRYLMYDSGMEVHSGHYDPNGSKLFCFFRGMVACAGIGAAAFL